MPICPKCNTAYLAGEAHVCVPKSKPWAVAVGAVLGAMAGAVGGYLVLAAIFCVGFGGNQCGLVAVFCGLPAGGVAGAIVGVRVASGRISYKDPATRR
jgi:hypothetical protein